MAIGQAFGTILTDGTINGGSGNFTVTKQGTGTYKIDFQGDFHEPPCIAVTVVSYSPTANASTTDLDYTWGGNGSATIVTGESEAADFQFCFVAMWN